MTLEIIPADRVDISRIHEIFKGAFLETDLTDEGTIRVTEGGIKILVSVDASKELIRYLMLFACRPGASGQDQLELVNDLNKNIVFMRAWSFGNGIAFDYSLPYDGGLLPHQVISAYRWLRKSALGGLQQHDHKGIVT